MLWSDMDSKLLVYIVGNGAQGLHAMPKGEQIYAYDLIEALKEFKAKGMYKDMVLLLDQPEASSFFSPFSDVLEDLNVLAVSGTEHNEEQKGTYCPPDEIVGDKHIKTCMANLFSALIFDEIEAALTEKTLGPRMTWNDVVAKVQNKSTA